MLKTQKKQNKPPQKINGGQMEFVFNVKDLAIAVFPEGNMVSSF